MQLSLEPVTCCTLAAWCCLSCPASTPEPEPQTPESKGYTWHPPVVLGACQCISRLLMTRPHATVDEPRLQA